MIIIPLMCVSLTIFNEARGSNIMNQMLVARSVITRAKDQNTNDYCAIVFKKNQYSWTSKFKFKSYFTSFNKFLNYYKIKEKQTFLKSIVIAYFSLFNDKEEIRYFYSPKLLLNKPIWAFNKKIAYLDQDFVFYRK